MSPKETVGLCFDREQFQENMKLGLLFIAIFEILKKQIVGPVRSFYTLGQNDNRSLEEYA